MIYLEVTTSAKSARNTGIQRVTRRIFEELSIRVPVTPISWNIPGRRFQRLSSRERSILEAPFRVRSRPSAHPELRGENVVADVYRLIFHKTLRLEDALGSGDVFLIPDIYRDARTRILPELISKMRGRSVAIFHDAAALQLPALYARGGPGFRRYIESLTAYDLVICVSRSSQDDLQRLWEQYGVSPARTAVEPWPVAFPEAERDGGGGAQRNSILCVGSFEPRKNHRVLFRAATALWNRGILFDLVLIGRSTSGFGWKIGRDIRRLQNMGHPVEWLRHVEDRVLHQAYRDCRFTVYPSLSEGFGLPILESLWHGKPCICGGNGALGEAAREGGCLIVDQTSSDSMAAAMERLLTDRTIHARLSNEARARRFRSWSDYMGRLLDHLSPGHSDEKSRATREN